MQKKNCKNCKFMTQAMNLLGPILELQMHEFCYEILHLRILRKNLRKTCKITQVPFISKICLFRKPQSLTIAKPSFVFDPFFGFGNFKAIFAKYVKVKVYCLKVTKLQILIKISNSGLVIFK